MRKLMAIGLAVVITVGAEVAGFGFGLEAALAAQPHPALKPPVIHEGFTLLPCNQKTTVGIEGCAEHRLITADKRIDKEVALLFSLLYDDAAKLRLVQAETAWLSYRDADCRSQSDIYEGGSEADVEYATCEVSDDGARSNDLHTFYEGLVQGRNHPPAFP